MANKNIRNSQKTISKKKIKKKKRKTSKIKIVIIVLFLCICGISAYLLTSQSFKIKDIRIKGNNKVSRQQILQLAKINIGDNIFSKISVVMKVKLKQNGYIEDVLIYKKYPNNVEINITERKQQFQIQVDDGGYIYIDEQGYILEYGKDKLEIPTIIGLDIKAVELEKKKRLGEQDLEKMENILQIRHECNSIGIDEKITKYEVSQGYIISLENDGIIINLGDATDLKNRMYYVKAIMKQEAGNRGIIYVNGNLNEGFSAYFSAN